jgi:hypothetical protein
MLSPRAAFITASVLLFLGMVFWSLTPTLGLITDGRIFLVGFGVGFVLAYVIHAVMTCPGCGHPMLRQRMDGPLGPMVIRPPWPPKACAECGARLDKA